MNVIYPTLFFEEKNGDYSVFIPDLEHSLNCNASTSGKNLEEAIYMAKDLIAGLVLDEMEKGNKIPTASKIEKISINKYEKELDIPDWDYVSKFKTYVIVDISSFAKKWGKDLVKKTVNIPKWLNTKAEALKINFSKTLEEALLERIYKI